MGHVQVVAKEEEAGSNENATASNNNTTNTNIVSIHNSSGGGGANTSTVTNSTVSNAIENKKGNSSQQLLPTGSISMFDWQYELQKKLQKPQIINYSQQSNGVENEARSEEHTSELQSRQYLVCRLLLEKKKQQ